ncbi:hypothetical protein Tco_0866679 [Tanacetum coccineum]
MDFSGRPFFSKLIAELVNKPTSGNHSVSVISFEEAAELDAVLSKSRDSQSSIFFSPENIRLREGFPSLLTSTDTDR